MTLFTTIFLALREVRRHLLRSMLTTLGIMIGVGAVILMVTLGRGAQRSITSQISSLGRNLLILFPESAARGGGPKPTTPFKEEDIQAIIRDIPDAIVAPQANRSLLVIFGNENRPTTITGVDNNFFEARDWKLATGRAFSDAELRAGKMVCVIGAT